jgi:hypothetical protein
MKRRLIFTVLVVFSILAQIGWYYLLTAIGLSQDSPLLICLTVLPGAAFWCVPFWYAFVYSKKQPPACSNIKS